MRASQKKELGEGIREIRDGLRQLKNRNRSEGSAATVVDQAGNDGTNEVAALIQERAVREALHRSPLRVPSLSHVRSAAVLQSGPPDLGRERDGGQIPRVVAHHQGMGRSLRVIINRVDRSESKELASSI